MTFCISQINITGRSHYGKLNLMREAWEHDHCNNDTVILYNRLRKTVTREDPQILHPRGDLQIIHPNTRSTNHVWERNSTNPLYIIPFVKYIHVFTMIVHFLTMMIKTVISTVPHSDVTIRLKCYTFNQTRDGKMF